MTFCNFFREVRSKFLGQKCLIFKPNHQQSSTTPIINVVPKSEPSTSTQIDRNNNNDDDHPHATAKLPAGSLSNLSTNSDPTMFLCENEFVLIDNRSDEKFLTNDEQSLCLPRRYNSMDVNQRRNKLNLDLDLSRYQKSPNLFIQLSKKSRIINNLEMMDGSPFFGAKSFSPSQSTTTMQTSLNHLDAYGEEISQNNSTITINDQHFTNVLEQDFHIISELGSGNFGYVQKCRHLKSGYEVAIKRMKFGEYNFEDVHRHVSKDLELLSKSRHVNIVQFYGYILTGNQSELWLCMELMDACFDRLIKHLKTNHLTTVPENMIGAAAISMIDALHYLKQIHNCIHRDIKPSNILINHCGYIKLCDFGISGCLVDSKTSSQTMGSLAYQAPERFQPDYNIEDKVYYDSRVDVWSLGLTLLEMALGHFPYQDWSGPFEIITKIMNKQEVPSLPSDRKQYSKYLRQFIRDCLQYDFQNRPKYEQLKCSTFYQTHKKCFNIRSVKRWLNSVYPLGLDY